MGRELKAEWQKLRRRKIGLLLLAFLGVSAIWSLWGVWDAKDAMREDGYRMLFLQLPLIDTILLPTMTAMLASRLCDTEVKGNTLKLLCTMEKKGRLFDWKLALGAWYLGLYVLGQIVLILVSGHAFAFVRPLNPVQLGYFILEVFVTSMLVLILQQVLSFFFENQILPLAAGLFGSFVGLFAWFFPGNPLRMFIPWGYYALLGFINYSWDESTRITTYYDVPFDYAMLGLLLAVLILSYIIGKSIFLRKEL